MGKELELKFSATPDALQQLRNTVDGAETIYQMQTTYYDTSDGLLSQRRCTLRCRLENGQKVCTLKTPLSDTARGEFDVCGTTIWEAIPVLAQKSGMDELLSIKENLIEACGAKFKRIAKEIKTENFVAELALDEGILLGGGKEIPLCEIELEYKSGDEQAFLHYAEGFGVKYGLQTEKRSKFARAMALAKGE